MEKTKQLAAKITNDNMDSLIHNVSFAIHDIMRYVKHISCLDMMTDFSHLVCDLRLFGKTFLYVHPLHSDRFHRMQAYAIKYTLSLYEVSTYQVKIKVEYEIIDEKLHDDDCKYFIDNYTQLVNFERLDIRTNELIYTE